MSIFILNYICCMRSVANLCVGGRLDIDERRRRETLLKFKLGASLPISLNM
jgi:hypothetical protein